MGCQFEWCDLPRHFEGPVEPSAHNLQGPALHLVAPHRPEPERPPRAGDCTGLLEGPGEARPDCARVGAEVRNMSSLPEHVCKHGVHVSVFLAFSLRPPSLAPSHPLPPPLSSPLLPSFRRNSMMCRNCRGSC